MAGYIPKTFINELLARADIAEVIDTRLPLKKSGHSFTACCPFHNEKTPSFHVSRQKQFFYCFGCGKSGNVLSFLMEYDRLSFVEAVENLSAQLGIAVPYERGSYKPKVQQDSNLYELIQQCADYYHQQLHQNTMAKAYCEQRGISEAIINQYQLGYAPEGWDNILQRFDNHQNLLKAGLIIAKDSGGYYDRFRNRLMFTIQDRQGRCIGFGGRVFDQSEPKYLNSPETPLFHKGSELYGLHQVLTAVRDIPYLIVVEGYMDVLGLVQHGIQTVVATLGTATTKNHLERLFRYTEKVIFCFDGDNAGKKAAWRALENALPTLTEGRQISFMFLPEGEDPDSLIREIGQQAFEQYIEKAKPLSEYFFQHLIAQVDIHSLDGRAKLTEIAKPLLNQIPKGIFSQMMFSELANVARIDNHILMKDKSSSSKPIKAKNPTLKQRFNPIALATILLLEQPELVELVQDIPLNSNTNHPDLKLFAQLVVLCQQFPNSNTATLLANWPGDEQDSQRQQIVHYATQQHMLPTEGIREEFADIMNYVKKQSLEDEINQLMSLASQQALDSEHKKRLQQLIDMLKNQ